MKKLLIIFTIIIITFLNLNSWNSQNFVFSNSKLDPALTIDDLPNDIINNPAQLNNLQKRYLHLGVEVAKDNHKSGVYAHNFQKFKMAISFNHKGRSTNLDSNINIGSNFALTFARKNYGIAYRYDSSDVNYTRSSETDNSLEETESEEPIIDFKKEETISDNEYQNHEISIGWLKELKSGKKIDFVSSIGLLNEKSDSDLYYERSFDKDPDDDGEIGGYYNSYGSTIITETSSRKNHIDSDISLLKLCTAMRIIDDCNEEKLKSLSFGLSYSMIVDDETKGSGVDSLYTEAIELENFITDSSIEEYFWNEKEEKRFSYFIAKGVEWKKWDKFNILLSNKLSSNYGIVKYHSTTNEKKKTTEFQLDLKSYLRAQY